MEAQVDVPVDVPAEKPKPWPLVAWGQGALAGVFLAFILGFGFGGWVTGSYASNQAAASKYDAEVEALASVCAGNFLAQRGAPGKVEDLRRMSWNGGGVVEGSGFATLPRSAISVATTGDVARICAEIILGWRSNTP